MVCRISVLARLFRRAWLDEEDGVDFVRQIHAGQCGHHVCIVRLGVTADKRGAPVQPARSTGAGPGRVSPFRQMTPAIFITS